jgi:hypothetical protein
MLLLFFGLHLMYFLAPRNCIFSLSSRSLLSPLACSLFLPSQWCFVASCARVQRAVMEQRFSIEAKSFCFSTKEGFSDFRLEERRKNFVGFIFASTQCSSWLEDTVEVACQVKEDVAKSYREGDKVLMVHRGAYKAMRFFKVSVLCEG